MTVRAKFTVNEITIRKSWRGKDAGNIYTILLNPVTSGSAENEQFYEATPGGKIELQTIKEPSGLSFELGKSFYVDFSVAED